MWNELLHCLNTSSSNSSAHGASSVVFGNPQQVEFLRDVESEQEEYEEISNGRTEEEQVQGNQR